MGALVGGDFSHRQGSVMRLLSILRLRLRSILMRRRVERELDEELRYHLERQIEQGIAAGMNGDEARYAAIQAIKDIEQRKEECRDMRKLSVIDNAVQDVRYAVRGLRRSPGFALLAVLIVALGIGANTAVFSVVNGVLLKPLAYRDPDRIVTLTTEWNSGTRLGLVTLPDFRDWQNQNTAFSAMACYRSSDEPTSAGNSAEYAHVARVSDEFFKTLAVEPVVGRFFSAEEQRSGDSGTAEIGLRVAMGATPRQVLRLILRQGMGLASSGMALGLLGSLAGTRLMGSMLFDVRPNDPLTYLAVALLLGVVLLAANYVPAQRAARLDPLIALRQE